MSSKFIKTKYAVPHDQLPHIDHSEHIDDMRELRQWMKDVGINVKVTRIDRYVRYLEQMNLIPEEDGSGIFNDPPVHPFKSALDRYMYVLREVHELMWIFNGFRHNPPKGFEKKFTEIAKGSDFAALDRDSTSRNTQFELRIASYFCRNSYSVDISTETDIVATSPHETFFVECKRLSSQKQVDRRKKEAASQLQGRLPPSRLGSKCYGIAAFDVTKLAFEHNGLTWGVTADHSRDVIRDKISEIGSRINFANPVLKSKNNLLVWLQIHIPTLILEPPQPATRFTSLFIVNPRNRGGRARAFDRLRSVLETAEYGV